MFEIETIVTQRNNINWKRIVLFALFFMLIIIVDIIIFKLHEKDKSDALYMEQYIKNLPNIISKFNAIDNWEKQLSNTKAYQTGQIDKNDLEKLWTTDRPILFVGVIKNVEAIDKHNNIISLQYYSKWYKFPPLMLQLICNNDMLNLALKRNPNIAKHKTIAVIAKIKEIKIERNQYSNESIMEIPIGYGNCLDVLHGYIYTFVDDNGIKYSFDFAN